MVKLGIYGNAAMLIDDRFLPLNRTTGIIHIGAHNAEELSSYISKGINDVLWVEANTDLSGIILNAIASHPNMHLGIFAASDRCSYVELNISNNTQSSSVLPLGTHATEYPEIKFTAQRQVPMRPVDDWIDEKGFNRKTYNFVNLDVQGYELMALKGLTKQMKFVDFIYTEVNVKELYAGCPKIGEIDAYLAGHGFKRLLTCITDQGWGDALYSRQELKVAQLSYNLFNMKRIVKKCIKASARGVLLKSSKQLEIISQNYI
jgi:FkbM family methyltransferase